MRSSILALCLALLGITTHAQMAHYYLASNRNEVARSVKTLSDGSSIIAGYIYDLDVNNDITNADNILLRVNPDGTIVWQKQWGTTNDDLLFDVIITQNGDIVTVGTAGRTGFYQNNHAAIYRFDVAGNLLASSFVRDSNTTTGGEVFYGVSETANGDLVAVGSRDFAPSTTDGLVSVFSSGLGNLYNKRIPLSNGQSDVFTSVVSDSNKVYILAYMYRNVFPNTTYYDQVLIEFAPAVGVTGTVNWMRYYDLAYNATADGQTFPINSDWPVKIFVQGSKLLVSGAIQDGWGGSVDRHYIFRCDKAGGLNPLTRMVNNGVNPFKYSNSSMIAPLNDSDMYVANTPGGQYYDYNRTGLVTNMDVWAGHVTSLDAMTLPVSTKIQFNGNESVQAMDIKTGIGNLNGYVYLAGNAQEPGFLDNDIYLGIMPPSLKDASVNCPADSTSWLDTAYTNDREFYVAQDSFPTRSNLEVSFENLTLASNLQCGHTLHNKMGTTSVTQLSEPVASLIIAPNPSNGVFNVYYGIPADFDKAYILVTDITGRIIGTKLLIEKNGSINIDLGNIASGQVICSIVVDDQLQKSVKVMIH